MGLTMVRREALKIRRLAGDSALFTEVSNAGRWQREGGSGKLEADNGQRSKGFGRPFSSEKPRVFPCCTGHPASKCVAGRRLG